MAYPSLVEGGLAAGSVPAYHGATKKRTCVSYALRSNTMKARLFVLALAVAPLAAMIGAVRSGR